MNKIFIIGNLGKDPETRFTASGQKVTAFTMATNKRRGDQDETLWYRITVWGDRFDKMIQYLKKGSLICVTGELSLNKWTDASGQEKTSLEVTADTLNFLPNSKGDQSEGKQQEHGSFEKSNSQTGQSFGNDFSGYDPAQTIAGKGAQQTSGLDEDPLPF